MSIEQIEITKDNLAFDTFLSMLANVQEVYNKHLQREDITVDEVNKILSQTIEAYSFYKLIKEQNQ